MHGEKHRKVHNTYKNVEAKRMDEAYASPRRKLFRKGAGLKEKRDQGSEKFVFEMKIISDEVGQKLPKRNMKLQVLLPAMCTKLLLHPMPAI